MPEFQYSGRDSRGSLITGRIEADSAGAAATRLFNTGVTPIAIEAAVNRAIDLSALMLRLGAGRPKTGDLIMFSRQMYTITKSGIPLLRGLRALCDSTRNEVLRAALQDVIGSLEAGRDLATSLARHPDIFESLYVSIIRVGESTGTLDTAFLRMCEHLALDQDIQDRVRGAMRYPLMVVIAVAVALAVITTFVIPNFAPIFRILGDDIPMPTRIILGVSTFTQQHWQGVLAGLAGCWGGFRWWIGTDAGRYRWHRALLRMPAVGGMLHQAILARIARSLSVSLNAGLPMTQTLSVIARSAGNDYMAEQVTQIRNAVERGESLSRAATGVGMFPGLVIQMMLVGEETGELPALLSEVADYYEREVNNALKNLSAAIEPVLIVAVGGIVLILALGVFLPLWEMLGKVAGPS